MTLLTSAMLLILLALQASTGEWDFFAFTCVVGPLMVFLVNVESRHNRAERAKALDDAWQSGFEAGARQRHEPAPEAERRRT